MTYNVFSGTLNPTHLLTYFTYARSRLVAHVKGYVEVCETLQLNVVLLTLGHRLPLQTVSRLHAFYALWTVMEVLSSVHRPADKFPAS